MAKSPLWEPSAERIRDANMTRFMSFVNDRYGSNISTYHELYEWSVNNIADFWASVWDFVGIKASEGYQMVVEDLTFRKGRPTGEHLIHGAAQRIDVRSEINIRSTDLLWRHIERRALDLCPLNRDLP